MRGHKDTHAQHWTTISTCTVPFTVQEMQYAKSSQFSHRQHYHDYKSTAWNPANSPRNSCYCRKKTGNKVLHKSCTLNPYIWTLQTRPDTKSSLLRKAIHPFTLGYLRDMVRNKKRFIWVFVRPLEESCHYVLWSTQAALRVLLTKKLLFPSAKLKPGSAERHHKSELALSFQKSHQMPRVMANLYCMLLPIPPSPSALAQSFWLRHTTQINDSSGRISDLYAYGWINTFPLQTSRAVVSPAHAGFVGSTKTMNKVKHNKRNQ